MDTQMSSTWFGDDVIRFYPCFGAAKPMLRDRIKVNQPMKLDSSLH